MPKEKRIERFVNWKMIMKVPEKDVENNVLTVETEMKATKPEIKQYLEKIYGLNVLKVNTLRTMGKIKKTRNRSRSSVNCSILQVA